MRLLIKNCRIADAITDYGSKSDILIRDGIVEKIASGLDYEADHIIDARGLYALPGFVDMHVHFREPGFEYKETVRTGSRSAAKGGYTSVCCMPNTRPVIDNEKELIRLLEIIEAEACINVFPIAAISKEQNGTELTDMSRLKQLGAVAFSDDGRPVHSDELLRSALKTAKDNSLLLIDHCEDLKLVAGGVINEGQASKRLGLKGISALSEELPIARDIQEAEMLDARIHIAHISTAGSAELIRKAKQRGVKVTCEVTPHHLALSEDIIEQGYTDCKVNPPLRTINDVQLLWKAVADGTVDVIATDHAPHSKEDKGEDFYIAAFGISGIETAFSVCFTTLVREGIIDIRRLTRIMSYNPARILGIDKGIIAEGKTADIVLVDTEKKVIIDKNSFVSKSSNTPFHGRSYYGEVVYTICNGMLVYTNNNIKED